MPTTSLPTRRSAPPRGFSKPTSKHEAAFEGAVDEITVASQRLLVAIAANLPHHS